MGNQMAITCAERVKEETQEGIVYPISAKQLQGLPICGGARSTQSDESLEYKPKRPTKKKRNKKKNKINQSSSSIKSDLINSEEKEVQVVKIDKLMVDRDVKQMGNQKQISKISQDNEWVTWQQESSQVELNGVMQKDNEDELQYSQTNQSDSIKDSKKSLETQKNKKFDNFKPLYPSTESLETTYKPMGIKLSGTKLDSSKVIEDKLDQQIDYDEIDLAIENLEAQENEVKKAIVRQKQQKAKEDEKVWKIKKSDKAQQKFATQTLKSKTLKDQRRNTMAAPLESQDTMKKIMNTESDDLKISTRNPTYYSFDKEEDKFSAGSATIISNSQLCSYSDVDKTKSVTKDKINLIAIDDNDSVKNLQTPANLDEQIANWGDFQDDQGAAFSARVQSENQIRRESSKSQKEGDQQIEKQETFETFNAEEDFFMKQINLTKQDSVMRVGTVIQKSKTEDMTQDFKLKQKIDQTQPLSANLNVIDFQINDEPTRINTAVYQSKNDFSEKVTIENQQPSAQNEQSAAEVSQQSPIKMPVTSGVSSQIVESKVIAEEQIVTQIVPEKYVSGYTRQNTRSKSVINVAKKTQPKQLNMVRHNSTKQKKEDNDSVDYGLAKSAIAKYDKDAESLVSSIRHIRSREGSVKSTQFKTQTKQYVDENVIQIGNVRYARSKTIKPLNARNYYEAPPISKSLPKVKENEFTIIRSKTQTIVVPKNDNVVQKSHLQLAQESLDAIQSPSFKRNATFVNIQNKKSTLQTQQTVIPRKIRMQGTIEEDRIMMKYSQDRVVFRWLRKTDFFCGYQNLTPVNKECEHYRNQSNAPFQFNPTTYKMYLQQFDQCFPAERDLFKVIIGTINNQLVVCGQLWIEQQFDEDKEHLEITKTVGHIPRIITNKNNKRHTELLKEFYKVAEELAWLNKCTELHVPCVNADKDLLKQLDFEFREDGFDSAFYFKNKD